jgi:hypothetical protein
VDTQYCADFEDKMTEAVFVEVWIQVRSSQTLEGTLPQHAEIE